MATTYLADLVTQLRKDLHDTDSTAYRWTDDQLERHVERALAEFSEASPLTGTADITTEADTRAYDLSDVEGLSGRPASITAVTFPYVATDLPTFARYRIWDDTLTILTTDAPAAGQTIRVWYTKPHTLTDSTKTLTIEDEAIIQMGAAGYAALELESYSADRVTLSKFAVMDYRSYAKEQLSKFYRALQDHIRQRALNLDSRQVWDTSNL